MNRVLVQAAALLAVIVLSSCGGDGDDNGMPGMSGMGTNTATDAPFDARFIDSMIVHHEAAVAMARQALASGAHPEIKAMANDIIRAQEAETAQMRQWRKDWYPDLPPTNGLQMDMGAMQIVNDPARPFDLRFIEAMIPHHQGAIAMATGARTMAVHTELRTLASSILSAQQGEIAQMEQWKREWFAQ